MRALLVVNPAATTTTARTREVIARALGSDLKVDVVETQHRGHAMALAAAARADGLDLVVTLGGDGTVNEVVNGLLREVVPGAASAGGASPAADQGPMLAVVPGGSTNVFARALHMPDDPVEATAQVLEGLRERRIRRVGLGRADDRWFCFNAGLGLDAEVVAEVERRRQAGSKSTHALYVRTALSLFFRSTERRSAPITVERPGHEPVEGLFFALVQNTAPWTYLGTRPVNPCPDASFDTGLDLFGLSTLRTVATLRHVVQLLRRDETGPRGRHVVALHDEAELTLTSDRPMAFQLDGEHLGDRDRLTFSAVPGAVSVVV